MKERQNFVSIPHVYQEGWGLDYYFYDMQYYSDHQSFFEFIHANTLEKSIEVLNKVMHFLKESIHVGVSYNNRIEDLNHYIIHKILMKVEDASNLSIQIASISGYQNIFVNSIEYLNFFQIIQKIQASPFILQELSHLAVSALHGDVTIDNILVNDDSIIVLDSNNENFLSDPAVDYAKLFQSLHSGYEFLCLLKTASLRGNTIHFDEHVSQKYFELFKSLDSLLLKRLTPAQYRTILFHEAVHYFRMLTYRAKISPETAIIFFGVGTRLLNEFYRQYEPILRAEKEHKMRHIKREDVYQQISITTQSDH